MNQGQIQNREEFLNGIATKLKRERTREVALPQWNYQPQWEIYKNKTQDELADILEVQCEKIHTKFVRASSKGLSDTLLNVIEMFNGKSVVCSGDSRLTDFDVKDILDSLKDEMELMEWNKENPDECRKFAEKADVGISVSDITLAESGTVTLISSNDHGRLISLLPTSYIAIVPKSTLVPRLTQAARFFHQQNQSGTDISSCISFVTGPSNSADIEMNLIVGVHGPVDVAYILVEDK